MWCAAGAEYDIDGLRLDVAYCLDLGFLAELRALADAVKPEFVLVGRPSTATTTVG